MDVVEDGPESGIEAERNPVGGDEPDKGNDDDEGGVEPVDVLVKAAPGHGRVGNVHLGLGSLDLGTSVASKGHIVLRAIGKGGGSLCVR